MFIFIPLLIPSALTAFFIFSALNEHLGLGFVKKTKPEVNSLLQEQPRKETESQNPLPGLYCSKSVVTYSHSKYLCSPCW